jgi:pimeloyl-ACP methyl ester carboxylesterase
MGGTQSGRPLPEDRWSAIAIPALILNGGKSPAWLHNAASATAGLIPAATHRVVPGQTHMVKAPALAPVLADFFQN